MRSLTLSRWFDREYESLKAVAPEETILKSGVGREPQSCETGFVVPPDQEYVGKLFYTAGVYSTKHRYEAYHRFRNVCVPRQIAKDAAIVAGVVNCTSPYQRHVCKRPCPCHAT